MTANIGQSGRSGVLRLGNDPHRDIAVRDNATDLMALDENRLRVLGSAAAHHAWV
jgi:hypothetical protein